MPHYHPSADLSESIGPTNAWEIYSAGCVSKINYILAIIFYAIYGVVLFQLTNFSFDDCENIFTSSYFIIIFKMEIWIVGHCLGLCDETNLRHLFLIYPFVLVIVIYFEECVEGGGGGVQILDPALFANIKVQLDVITEICRIHKSCCAYRNMIEYISQLIKHLWICNSCWNNTWHLTSIVASCTNTSTQKWISIGSGNGLLLDGTNTLRHQRWLLLSKVLWRTSVLMRA